MVPGLVIACDGLDVEGDDGNREEEWCGRNCVIWSKVEAEKGFFTRLPSSADQIGCLRGNA